MAFLQAYQHLKPERGGNKSALDQLKHDLCRSWQFINYRPITAAKHDEITDLKMVVSQRVIR